MNTNRVFVILIVALTLLVAKLYYDKLREDKELLYASESQILKKSSENNEGIDKNQILALLNKVNNELPRALERIKEIETLSKNFETLVKKLSETSDNDKAVKIFDLSKPLEPESDYKPIACRASQNIQNTVCTLCVHDIQKDVHVSGSIWSNGIWEHGIVSEYMSYIVKYPDALVLDIGAQIGQYSLFAAKAGRKVITVEPFHDNILRLHKASTTDKTQSRITLIKNALSNKRNEIKMLHPNSNNIGGQSLLENRNRIFSKNDLTSDPNAKYLVETILWDDIVPYIPLNDDKKKYQNAILKIDIEGFEPFAFQNATKFFETLNILIIFMEWGNFPHNVDIHPVIEQMIDFLLSRGFVPHGNGNAALQRENWKTSWSWDIVWRKKDV